jgi:hypothetical protein
MHGTSAFPALNMCFCCKHCLLKAAWMMVLRCAWGRFCQHFVWAGNRGEFQVLPVACCDMLWSHFSFCLLLVLGTWENVWATTRHDAIANFIQFHPISISKWGLHPLRQHSFPRIHPSLSLVHAPGTAPLGRPQIPPRAEDLCDLVAEIQATRISPRTLRGQGPRNSNSAKFHTVTWWKATVDEW